jgi:endonuclease/exonuclease/phosphatase family metal-dependent hydrolase
MTYNIRACLGTDRRRAPERIAQVIEREAPDIVALQEVDFHRARSGDVDQGAVIARLLGMHDIDGESFADPAGGAYGNALLTPHDAFLVRHAPLPVIEGTEQRSAMWATVQTPLGRVDVVNTHLSFRARDRRWQAEALLGPEWIGDARMGERMLLCGDLNCAEGGAGFRALRRRLRDAPPALRRGRRMRTWPTRFPMRRIDFILTSQALAVTGLRVVRTALARVASDHFPVVAEVSLQQQPSGED